MFLVPQSEIRQKGRMDNLTDNQPQQLQQISDPNVISNDNDNASSSVKACVDSRLRNIIESNLNQEDKFDIIKSIIKQCEQQNRNVSKRKPAKKRVNSRLHNDVIVNMSRKSMTPTKRKKSEPKVEPIDDILFDNADDDIKWTQY